tara:strand:- start:2906 stop:3301 length:396 start_codon:yes stop_codon:yes gene_type:complete
MGLFIEILIEIKKSNSITSNTQFLSSLAKQYNCIKDYFIYETEGLNNNIYENNCIHIIEFKNPETEFCKNNIIKYIKTIINNKYGKLETIYRDEGKIETIFSSIKSKYIASNGREKIVKQKPILTKIEEKL